MPTTTVNLGRVKGSMWYTGTADSDTAIATALTSAGYVPIKLDMYLNTSNGNVFQYSPVDNTLKWLLKGNIRGAQGEGFQIKKTYDSVAAMNAGYETDNVPLYGFVLIDTGDVNDAENARLYVKGDTAYNFLCDLSGAQGIKGEKGEKGDTGDTGAAAGFGTPTAEVEPTTGTPSVTVTASGADTAKVFAFHFAGLKGEKGDKGDEGDKGDTGDTGTAATVQVGTVQTGAAGSQAQVTNSGSNSAAVLNFVIPKGDKGDTGEDGKTPTFSVNENGELIATFE